MTMREVGVSDPVAGSRWTPLATATLAVVVSACAAREAPVRHEPTPEEWTKARRFLGELRASARRDPHVVRVIVAITEPRSGKTVDGRGVVAVDPGRALRMVLLGPGGVTALDAWITPGAWRFAIPALEMVRRGGASNDDARGLPVGFFRWWFLAPLDGDLLTANASRDGGDFLLRRGTAVAHVSYALRGHRLEIIANRRQASNVERIDWLCATLETQRGDRGVYVQDASGLRVQIEVEAIAEDPPSPESFVDPDAPGGVR